MTETLLTVSSTIRAGQSWADQADSPGWAARSPPKFSDEIPDIVLDEEEYDRLPASASACGPIAVFVGGLDYALESRDLEDFFSGKGVRVSRVRILKQNGKSSGKAFLNVSDQATLSAILKLNGSTLSGRQLKVKEDSGPRPARTTSARMQRTTTSKMGGRWREEEKPKQKSENSWQAVGKGGKVFEHHERRKPPHTSRTAPETTEDVPKERKKLELKPRSKPVGEENESARSSAIFGSARPRDEAAYEKRKSELEVEKPAAEETPVAKEAPKRKEKKEVKPVVVEAPSVAPLVAKPVRKKVVNRFAVDSSSELSEDEE